MQKLIVAGMLIAVLLLFGAGCLAPNLPADKDWHELIDPYQGSLDLTGYRLHYADIGHGPVVFMLHGFSSSMYAWKETIRPLLRAGHRVILIDLPGMGQSELPPFSPTAENLAEEVVKLADHLRIQSFDLVGASLGGGVTLYLCHRHPERIRRAVVIDPACFPQEFPQPLRLLARPRLGKLAAPLAGRWSVQASLAGAAEQEEFLTRSFVNEYSRPMNKPGYKTYIFRLIREFPSPTAMTMTEHYPEIQTPVLIIWGLKDKWVPPEFGSRLHGLLPNSRYLPIENVGHMPHLEAPAAVNDAILAFLQSGK